MSSQSNQLTIASRIYHKFLAREKSKGNPDIPAAKKLLMVLPENIVSLLEKEASAVTFSRRYYGRGVAYCWPHHKLFEHGGIVDPWPAAKYPESVLMLDLLNRMESQGAVDPVEYNYLL